MPHEKQNTGPDEHHLRANLLLGEARAAGDSQVRELDLRVRRRGRRLADRAMPSG